MPPVSLADEIDLFYSRRLIKLALLAFFLRFLPLGYTRYAVYIVATVVGFFTLATTLVSKPKSIPEHRGFLIIVYGRLLFFNAGPYPQVGLAFRRVVRTAQSKLPCCIRYTP